MYNLATLLLSLVTSVLAKSVFVINVGGNTNGDATTVFQPPSVTANMGDVVFFNCEHTSDTDAVRHLNVFIGSHPGQPYCYTVSL